jgi:LPXTG-motif cell wall-anchored protein
VTVAAPSRFDWVDAGIGAASGLGASLIAGGGLLLVLKRRRSVAVA